MRVVAVESIRPTAHAQGSDFSAQRALGVLSDVALALELISQHLRLRIAGFCKTHQVAPRRFAGFSVMWSSDFSHVFRGVDPFDKFS